MSEDATSQLAADGITEDRRVLRRLADGRYEGQGYEVRFEVPDGEITDAWLEELVERFHQAHETEYGHRFATGRVEIVNIRVEGLGAMDELPAPVLERSRGNLSDVLLDTQDVVFEAAGKPQFFSTPFYDRALLGAGDVLEGPCIVEQYDSTVVVPTAFTASIDNHGNIVIACPAKAEEAGSELATPILMRVIGGAFSSMAKEMASVLFRMSYSSIIRESEDLGAGIFDC